MAGLDKKAPMEAAAGAKGCRAAPPVKSGNHRGRWCLGLPGSHPGSFGRAGLGGHHLTDHLTYTHDWTTSFLGAANIAGPVPASPKSTPISTPSLARPCLPHYRRGRKGVCVTPTIINHNNVSWSCLAFLAWQP